MKKTLKIFVLIIIVIGSILIWYDQKRSFFKATNGEYMTMWKRVGGICYLIPGKYYGITKPKDGYVEMPTLAHLTVYYSDKLPNIILLRKESNYDYKAYAPVNKAYLFANYLLNKEKYRPIIYKEETTASMDINKDASYLSINILESYATDETGRTQR